MDLLEDGFDLLILTTSKWCDPRGHQPLYRQVWAKKVRVSNTSTTSKKSQLVFKKIIYWPRALLCPPARGWSPTRPPCPPAGPPHPPAGPPRPLPAPSCLTVSAPPWTTLVVVRITFAWCHSLFELRSSPLWLEMYVPSSTHIVNGFL